MDNEAVTKTEFYKEINKLVTKEEFQEKHDWLAEKVMLNTQSIKALDRKIDTKFEQVINLLDDVVGKLDDNRTEKLAIDYAFERVEKKVDQHEERISTIELQLAD